MELTPFAEVGSVGFAQIHRMLIAAQQTKKLYDPGWLIQRFGHHAGFVGDCGMNGPHLRPSSELSRIRGRLHLYTGSLHEPRSLTGQANRSDFLLPGA